ncbi:MAG: Gfo/Idh/MocA family protein [Spirochaetales bacterium]
MRKKGIGIVGLGTIAAVHAGAIKSLDDCRLVGGFEPRKDAREAFASAWSCQDYSSLDALLADPAIDIVVVCTPSGAHFDPALAALRASKHVIVEKPLEINLKKCRLLISEAQKAKRLLGGVFQTRFYRSSLLVKRALDAGRFGRLSLVQAHVPWFRTKEYYSASPWRGTWALDGGGAYMNQAIHMIDLVSWLMGKPEIQCCRAGALGHDGIEVEDTAIALLKWENRAFGLLAATTAAFPGFPKRLEIMGMEGTAIIEEDRITEWRFAEEGIEDEEIRALYGVGSMARSGLSRFEPEEESHRRQYRNFLDTLESKGRLVVDGEEAMYSVSLVKDLYRAAGIGKNPV